MRQAVEVQVLNPHCELGEHGLRQILTDVIEEVRQSVNHDIDGTEILHSLLNASWLQSLLKVYDCLQKYRRGSPVPALDYASGLSFQLLIDIRALPGCSEEARELYRILRQPHLQALLSAHDTVAQKDYEPVLPPMPEDVPEDEEATRTICLVKNKQPLLLSASPPPMSRGLRGHWGPLRPLTQQRLLRDAACGLCGPADSRSLRVRDSSSWCSLQRGRFTPPEPLSGGCPCCSRLCYTNLLWERSINRSAPSVYSSVLFDLRDEDGAASSPLSPFPLTHRIQRVRTAPPSPARPRHAPDTPRMAPVELAKQESLDELRATVRLAAGSMESNARDMKLLGEKMAAVTWRVSETVQDNSQAVVLLSEVVERLQTLLTEQDGTHRRSPKGGGPRVPLTHQSRCPSSSSSSSSSSSFSSSSSCQDAPSSSYSTTSSTSRGAGCLPTSCRGSPRSNLRNKSTPPPQKNNLNAKLYALPNGTKRGATIKRNAVTGEIFVARVIHGGLADRSGLLHAGDRIMEVNGFPVDGMEPEQVIQVVQARQQGTIMFKVVPINERQVHNQTMLYVRAMADYSPQQDPAIPCADAGMSFRKGDVLEIVDQSDALWWQAKKLPSDTACAGLIPSTNLLRRKQKEFWWSQPYQPHACMQTLSTVEEEEDMMAFDDKCVETDEEAFESEELRVDEDDFISEVEGIYLAGFRRSMRLCRRRAHSTTQPSCHNRCTSGCSSNSPYEEVVRYQRHPQDPQRLIVLLGPSGVGVNELRKRMIEVNPNIFQGPTPYTTRAPKVYEEPGREYYFTSREIFDNMVYNNRFLEYGEYKGNLYGTSIESVREVINNGKICVIDIEPNAIQAVRSHELRAYIVYVKPPPLEQLRETRRDSYITTNYYVNRPFKDEDFQEMEESARRIESHFCQFFDHVIVNEDLQDSCIQLLTAVKRAQDEPQWVPASWIRPTTEP